MPCALHQEHEALGAIFEESGGSEFVASYRDAPVKAPANKGPYITDSSADFRMLISGTDALRFLLVTTTIDAASLQRAGTITRALILDAQGQIIDSVIVARTGMESFLIAAGYENREELRNWLQDIAKIEDGDGRVFRDLVFQDLADDIVELSLIGRDALSVFEEITDGKDQGLEDGDFTEQMLDTIDCLVWRMGDEQGCLIRIYCPRSRARALFRAFLSFPQLTVIGMDAYEGLLMDCGYPVLSGDAYLTVEDSGLSPLVSDRDDFIGARALRSEPS